MPDWGFGSTTDPGATTSETEFDWGFGSPTPAGDPGPILNNGYAGSPLTIFGAWIESANAVVPDAGGIVLGVFAEWLDVGTAFRAFFVDTNGGDHPTGGAYSCIAGQGTSLYPNRAETPNVLRMAVPPLAPGIYDLRVEWGVNWAESYTISNIFRVVRRPRIMDAYRIRQLFPPQYATGPRRARDEDLL